MSDGFEERLKAMPYDPLVDFIRRQAAEITQLRSAITFATENAEADGQMRERERIVEWLGHFDPASADAIQRGEHWQ